MMKRMSNGNKSKEAKATVLVQAQAEEWHKEQAKKQRNETEWAYERKWNE